MIKSDDFEDDFFAPSSNATLANIFHGGSTDLETAENATLKYTPPKPSNAPTVKDPIVKPDQSEVDGAQSKTSKCLVAKAVFVYELINNAYQPRGKLGFAVMQVISQIKLVIYDINKTPISSATTHENFAITVRENNYMNYYDDIAKYWSILFSSKEDLHDVLNEIRKEQIKIKNETLDSKPALPSKPEIKKMDTPNIIEENESSQQINNSKQSQKSKASIVSRMAMMGHAVIPTQGKPTDITSDSSDTEPPSQIRHRPIKNAHVTKPISNEESVSSESVRTIYPPMQSQIMPVNFNSNQLFSYANGQLVPLPNKSMAENNVDIRSELNLFLSEHRASSSELRININRVTDKVDQIIDRIKNVNTCGTPDPASNSSVVVVYQKLLHEYEEKIKIKDARIEALEKQISNASQGSLGQPINIESHGLLARDLEALTLKTTIKNLNEDHIAKIECLRNDIAIKEDRIIILEGENNVMSTKMATLNDEINRLHKEIEFQAIKINELNTNSEQQQNNIENLIKKDLNNQDSALESEISSLNKRIAELSEEMASKQEENLELQNSKETICKDLEVCQAKLNEQGGNEINVEQQLEVTVKKLMNETYQMIIASLDEGESYSAETIRTVVAGIIKKATLDSLRSLKSS